MSLNDLLGDLGNGSDEATLDMEFYSKETCNDDIHMDHDAVLMTITPNQRVAQLILNTLTLNQTSF